MLINTSFNIRSERIINTSEDASTCFTGTHMDKLAIENFVLYKKEQDIELNKDYKNFFEINSYI